MEIAYQLPSILRLPGITLNDYVSVEDVADAHLLDGCDGMPVAPDSPAPESVLPFDKIPRVFTGIDDWPHHTNLRCWSCNFTFDDRPKFVPTHVREGDNGGIEFGVLGSMCTFNCVELWIETHYGGRVNNEERWRAQDNLCLVYFLFTGRHIAWIKPAPQKTSLCQYGGDWDEDTFWKELRKLDPVAGLRDHTPGSIVPERERVELACITLKIRAGVGAGPVPRSVSASAETQDSGGSLRVNDRCVWSVCGLLGEEPKPDSIVIDELDVLAPSDTRENGTTPASDDNILSELLREYDVSPVGQTIPSGATKDISAPVSTLKVASPAVAEVALSDMDALLLDMGGF